MKSNFVQLSNTARFMEGLEIVEQRGAAENCFMVVDGQPGFGKTTTTKWFATQHGLPFLRAKRGWRPTWMLREILDTVQAPHQHSQEKMFRSVIEEIGKRAAIARAESRPYAMMVDEADFVVGSSALVETLRDISDLIEVPMILVGMRRINDRLKYFPQVASRIEGGAHVEFQPLTHDDTRKLVTGLSSVEVTDDLIDLVHQKAGGFAREVMTGISAIERVGRRTGRAVGIADMEGQVLLTERDTGHQFVVRAA